MFLKKKKKKIETDIAFECVLRLFMEFHYESMQSQRLISV